LQGIPEPEHDGDDLSRKGGGGGGSDDIEQTRPGPGPGPGDDGSAGCRGVSEQMGGDPHLVGGGGSERSAEHGDGDGGEDEVLADPAAQTKEDNDVNLTIPAKAPIPTLTLPEQSLPDRRQSANANANAKASGRSQAQAQATVADHSDSSSLSCNTQRQGKHLQALETNGSNRDTVRILQDEMRRQEERHKEELRRVELIHLQKVEEIQSAGRDDLRREQRLPAESGTDATWSSPTGAASSPPRPTPTPTPFPSPSSSAPGEPELMMMMMPTRSDQAVPGVSPASAKATQLHTALSSMAAMLRVSQEEERKSRAEADALRQEVDYWKQEAARLLAHLQEREAQREMLPDFRHDSLAAERERERVCPPSHKDMGQGQGQGHDPGSRARAARVVPTPPIGGPPAQGSGVGVGVWQGPRFSAGGKGQRMSTAIAPPVQRGSYAKLSSSASASATAHSARPRP